MKKPLILVNIKVGYGTDPRWSNKSRKGKLDIFIRKKVEVEEIENLSNDELYALIKENLTVDNYSEHILYKGKNLAEDLERILYICPICNKQHTLSSKGDILTCSSCSTEFKYNEDLSLTSENNEFKFDYIDKWYDYQIDVIKNKEYDESLIYQDEVELSQYLLFGTTEKQKEYIRWHKENIFHINLPSLSAIWVSFFNFSNFFS